MNSAASATTAPGQVTGLVAVSVAPTSVNLSWSAPASGGAASAYSVQYRISGTTPWLMAGQESGSTSFIVQGLQPTTSYDFTVSAVNNIGTGINASAITVATPSSLALPGAPTAVIISNITTNSMTCSWAAPSSGGTGLAYEVRYSLSGQGNWNAAASNQSGTTLTITNLASGTSYDVEVIATNAAGSARLPIRSPRRQRQRSELVTSITWALTPSGSYAHGVGSIGINAHVNPANAQIQFGFSMSLTSPPTSWVSAVHINTDFWGSMSRLPRSSAHGTPGGRCGRQRTDRLSDPLHRYVTNVQLSSPGCARQENTLPGRNRGGC